MSDITNQHTLTLQLTHAQQQWLSNAAETLAKLTGHPVAHSAIVMRLMELGAPLLLDDIQQKKMSHSKSHLRLVTKD